MAYLRAPCITTFQKAKSSWRLLQLTILKDLLWKIFKKTFAGVSNPIDAFQAYVYELSRVFGQGGTPLGSPIGTIAGEKHSTSEPIRLACEATFKSWQSIYTEKFLEAGYTEQQSTSLATVFHALTEGGILFSFNNENGQAA